MFYPREADRDFLVHKYVAVMFFIFGAGLMALWTFRDGMTYAPFYFCGETAVGITTSTGATEDCRLTYEFQDRRGNRHSGHSSLSCSKGQHGKLVEITYLLKQPGISEANQVLKTLAPGFWILVTSAGVILLGGSYTFIAVIAWVRRRQEDRYY